MKRRIAHALTAAAIALATLAAGGCDMPLSRAEQCKADGNTVTTELDYDKKAKRYYTEYECVTPEGVEVDEWH